MTTAAIILNVIFSALVIVGIVGHLAWGVIADRSMSATLTRVQRRPRTRQARRVAYAQVSGARA
jgi:hypothetical protein